MSDRTFDPVLELAVQLDPTQRVLLVRRLEESIPASERDTALRGALLAESEALRAKGAYTDEESLFGKFAPPAVTWDEAELDAYLNAVGTAWEEDLDELTDDDTANP